MSQCNCHSDIIRDGSGQLQRYLKALDPSYAPIDGRSMEDLLVFAKRYAKQIRFYDIPDSEGGQENAKEPIVTWSDFFRRDMAVIAASLAVIDLEQIKKDYDETNTRLAQHPTEDVYAALYTNILGMAARLDRWYSAALPGYPLRADLELGIASSLKPAMQQIMAYEKGFPMVEGKALKLDYSAISNTELWGLDEDVPADTTIYAGVKPSEKIYHASLFTEDIFLKFYGFMSKLVDNADEYLQFAMEQYPAHQPHMALFIAFLELFRLAQEQMNGLTGRMLDFYYRDVLHLSERPSVPDRVHLVFELAKDVAAYDLAKGTTLLAGKDASGKDQIYATETDAVINNAKVKELKTLFIQKRTATLAGTNTPATKNITAFYAKPVANSADGNGAKFTVPNPKWPTFGEDWPVIDNPQNVCEAISAVKETLAAPEQAQVGFALASPQLLLQGGKRLVRLQFNGLQTLANYADKDNKPVFDIVLSAEKSWLQISKLASEEEVNTLEDAWNNGAFENDYIGEPVYYVAIGKEYASLNIYLPLSTAPIIAYDAKIHAGNTYATTQPVMQILLRDDIAISEEDYKSVSIGNLSIEVKVGSINKKPEGSPPAEFPVRMDGLRTLVLQNDNGALDPSKPFDPFTPYAFKGKSLYVGSGEVFNKNIDGFAINILHTNGGFGGNYAARLLYQRQWVTLYDTGFSRAFNKNNLSTNMYQQSTDPIGGDEFGPLDTLRKPIGPVTAWTGKEEKGFVRLDLETYLTTADSYEQARNRAIALEVKELTVSYHSLLSKLEAGIDQLFHVYPFGVAEVSLAPKVTTQTLKQLSTNLANRLRTAQDPMLVNARDRLLPQFTFTSVYQPYNVEAGTVVKSQLTSYNSTEASYTVVASLRERFPAKADQLMLEVSGLSEAEGNSPNQYSGDKQEEGLLFIGLEGAKPLNTVSLLFQFADGSARDNDNDPPVINWSYLVNNEWRPLKGEHIVSDDTYGFQTTGIVKLEIPSDATTSHSIITDGLHWFSASVGEHSTRIPQAVDVVAQAVVARFQDNGNASAHFDNALPAGSIAKLQTAAAEVSKVAQPFASFDGKHRETGKEFYMHVSERLRHKGRAITSWDYEHLVLDRFPSIYKVKCIQHTDQNCLCREPEPAVADRGGRGTMGKRETTDWPVGGLPPVSTDEGPAPQPATCCGPQVAPGHVLVVPIPNLKNRNDANPLQPKTSRRTLLEIEAYLKKRTSPFVHVHARNPVYEEVLVFFRVQFYAGVDKGYHLKKLNDELVRYLTPWAFDDTADVAFGRKVYASAIINFIEEQPYVDFITDFVMNVCLHACCPPQKETSVLEDTREASVSGDKQKDGGDDTAEVLAKIQGCDDMETLLMDADFTGYVVATPSTPRSILVSAPKHIIVPYEAPVRLTPCQQRKMQKSAESSERLDAMRYVSARDNVSAGGKEAPESVPTPPPAPTPAALASVPVPEKEAPGTAEALTPVEEKTPAPTVKKLVRKATITKKSNQPNTKPANGKDPDKP
jgi:hypothetical protein